MNLDNGNFQQQLETLDELKLQHVSDYQDNIANLDEHNYQTYNDTQFESMQDNCNTDGSQEQKEEAMKRATQETRTNS
eukprot:15089430-Heterocapsa_arctica.AAC.1